jgi:protocatechuate 3,4-dioxygenase beta subunit
VGFVVLGLLVLGLIILIVSLASKSGHHPQQQHAPHIHLTVEAMKHHARLIGQHLFSR